MKCETSHCWDGQIGAAGRRNAVQFTRVLFAVRAFLVAKGTPVNLAPDAASSDGADIVSHDTVIVFSE